MTIAPQDVAAECPAIKHITGISVIFDWDSRNRGQTCGSHNQADIVDAYGQRLNEELDYENVRTHPIDTRRPPILSEEERLATVPDGFLPVILSCDWYPRERQHNTSYVEFCGDLYKLADALCFQLGEWGHCTVFGHRVMRPIAVEGSRGFIRIKPFSINGPNADDYVRRLDKLGEDLGRAIGEYLTNRGEGLRK